MKYGNYEEDGYYGTISGTVADRQTASGAHAIFLATVSICRRQVEYLQQQWLKLVQLHPEQHFRMDLVYVSQICQLHDDPGKQSGLLVEAQ